MALNTLVIYLSFCFVIVVPEEMTQRYERAGGGGRGKGSGWAVRNVRSGKG